MRLGEPFGASICKGKEGQGDKVIDPMAWWLAGSRRRSASERRASGKKGRGVMDAPANTWPMCCGADAACGLISNQLTTGAQCGSF